MDNAAEEIEKRFQFVKEYQGSESEPPQWQNLQQLIERLPIGRNIDRLELSERVQELEIRADPMLKIVFHNLLEDSVKYASKPVKVRIGCEKREKGVMLIYEDVGPGIPEGMKESIFIKNAERGPGIGLFLCKQILSESNITIEEAGTPGKGAMFEMLVPAAQCRTAH
jgi:K+-sensing histidine kinase KdpD